MQKSETISKAQFDAYVSVQTSGHYNMFDPQARQLANNMNDCSISKSEWVSIMTNYNALEEQYKPSKDTSSPNDIGIYSITIEGLKGANMVLTNTDDFDFEGEDCVVVDPCYFFEENNKNKIDFKLWGAFCNAMFEKGIELMIKEDKKGYDLLVKEKCGVPIKGKVGLYREEDGEYSGKQELSYYDLPSKYRFDNVGLCELSYGKDKYIKFLYSGTSGGDGCFEVKNEGKSFGVDAGMYCVVKVSDLKQFLYMKDYNKLIDTNYENAVVVEKVGYLSFDGEGNLNGSIEVVTDGSDITMEQCDYCGSEFEEGEGYDDDMYCSHSCYSDDNDDND
tara:strand:- start:917 stop:1918 length:1002 start_codon:yes stop_codon:yes gene_type:complete